MTIQPPQAPQTVSPARNAAGIGCMSSICLLGIFFWLLDAGRTRANANREQAAVLQLAQTQVLAEERARARHLLLLSRSGLDLAATLARTKRGTEFRRWLVGTVLPAFRQEQALSVATTDQIRTAVRVEMDRQFRTPESKHAELMRCAGNTGEAFARILGCDAGQARAAAIELAKGLVGYGGTGRELGYVTTRQFKAMRALLQGLPSFVALAPRKRRRQFVRVIESGDGSSVQQVLPIFRAQADVGNAVVTVTVRPKKEAA